VSELIDYGWTTVPRDWLAGRLFSDREQMLQYRVALYAAVGFDKAKVRELMLLVEGMTLKEATQTLSTTPLHTNTTGAMN
jgi:hypothetical protein